MVAALKFPVNESALNRLLISSLMLFLMAGCGMLGKRYDEMHGRVLHEILDKPLSNSVVVALWKGTEKTSESEKEICYHVESTTTDEKGYFSFSDWREPANFKNLKNKTIHVFAYRKYYRTSELTSELITQKNYIYYLAKPREMDDETLAREDRLRYLQLLVGKTTCDLEGESHVNLAPLFKDVIEEAVQIAVTDKDRQIVEKLKSWLDYISTKSK